MKRKVTMNVKYFLLLLIPAHLDLLFVWRKRRVLKPSFVVIFMCVLFFFFFSHLKEILVSLVNLPVAH